MQDRELTSEHERISSSHNLEIDQLNQSHKIETMKQDHRLGMLQRTQTQSVEQKTSKAVAELEVKI